MRVVRNVLVLPFLLSLSACAASEPATDPSLLPPALQRGLPDLLCPAGDFKQAVTAAGLERWCEVEGKMNGPYERLTLAGTRLATGAYTNNLPDGGWVWYWENGQRRAQVRIVAGKRTAAWGAWHPNGQQAEAGEYLDGRLAGGWTAWHPNGQKAVAGGYQNGAPSPGWVRWDEAGVEIVPEVTPQ